MSKSIKSLMSFYLKNINTFWMSKPYPNINFKTFMNKKNLNLRLQNRSISLFKSNYTIAKHWISMLSLTLNSKSFCKQKSKKNVLRDGL